VTQARSVAISSGRRSVFGGIFGFARASICRINGLLSASLGTIGAPVSPPFIKSSKLSRSRPPSCFAELWQRRQFVSRIGITSRPKSGGSGVGT
jgi:hypothetical protein